jgi:hypothetical protein
LRFRVFKQSEKKSVTTSVAVVIHTILLRRLIDSTWRCHLSNNPKNKTEIDLRRMLPDVALRMETQFLIDEALNLGIKVRISNSKKTPIIRVPLTLRHSMTISPVDRGAQGFAEFFTFMPTTSPQYNYPELISRVHVQIYDELVEEQLSESFTIQAPNFEMILRTSLSIYYSIAGKKLAPIIIKGLK